MSTPSGGQEIACGRQSSGRKFVLCLDGTNNQYDAANTNVVKLYAMVDKSGTDQLAYYQPGIGTFAPPGVWGKTKRWFVTRMDLAVAWLLEDHVTCAYRYLMRYYQPGDQIFIFGFSRGAYTARALAGMLHKVGLLTQGNEELLPFAWDQFRRINNEATASGFHATFARDVKVHFLGLWDTVSSVGWAWAPQTLPNTMHNSGVDIVRHAVSLDERRVYFQQNLWGEPPQPGQSVRQVWFAGVHCDVGGGYLEKESGLSKIPLAWMVHEAEGAGLRFDAAMKASILPEHDTDEYTAANVEAMQHESLRRCWWIPEFVPKKWRDPTDNWTPKWIIHRGQHRLLVGHCLIHESVVARKAKVPGYDPPNWPTDYEIVKAV
jgi:uncharacterized protein (DUF2235 family)